MSTSRNLETPAGITPADIYFVVFRHKWKILVLTLLGVAAAAFFYFTHQPLYQSQAKIDILYVTQVHAGNPADRSSSMTSLLDLSQNAMNSEMEILTSYDLAAKVATNFGPDKILAKLGGGSNATAAAMVVNSHLKVESMKDSSVVYVTFSHPDPDLVRPVLAEIIADYKDKHVRVHSKIGMTDAQLQDKITQFGLDIAQTENELRMVKTNAGVISITETEKSNQEELSRLRRELSESRISLFEHQTGPREPVAAGPAPVDKTNSLASVPAGKVARYKFICKQMIVLDQQQSGYLLQGFPESNKLVKENREQTLAAERERALLETQFPALLELDSSLMRSTPGSHIPIAAGT